MTVLRKTLLPIAALCALLAAGGCRMEQRSDDAIAQTVTSRIQLDSRLAPFELVADSQQGVVTLSGTVDTPGQREQAEMLARATDGVKDVENRIAVSTEAPSRPDVAAPPEGGGASE